MWYPLPPMTHQMSKIGKFLFLNPIYGAQRTCQPNCFLLSCVLGIKLLYLQLKFLAQRDHTNFEITKISIYHFQYINISKHTIYHYYCTWSSSDTSPLPQSIRRSTFVCLPWTSRLDAISELVSLKNAAKIKH